MSLQIGRAVGLMVKGSPRYSGDTVQLEGYFEAPTVERRDAVMQQLRGLLEEPETVPVADRKSVV